MPPVLPTVSERYLIEEEIGRGGMAVVYRARDRSLGRTVALKVLHAHLQSQLDSRLRLTREAQAVAKLHHPNIVEIYDYSGEDAETAYLVTELIEGETLEAFLLQRKLVLPETALLLVVPICEALSHAHALGIVHRDIKPGNVMLRSDGAVKLMDFGIAQVLDAQGLTMTGTLLGSPAHMSPEHIEGRPLDARADVFSLGTLLYLAATGELPFQGRNPHALMRALLDCDVRAPQSVNALVSKPIERLLLKMLAREPAKRHGSVDEALGEVRACLASLGIHDPARELRDFFADPTAYEAELARRLVAARLRRGREALYDRRTAEALEHFNMILAHEPANAEVLGILRRIGRRRAIERASIGALVLGSIGALATLLWMSTDTPPERAPATRHTAAKTSPSFDLLAAAQRAGAVPAAAVPAPMGAISPAPPGPDVSARAEPVATTPSTLRARVQRPARASASGPVASRSAADRPSPSRRRLATLTDRVALADAPSAPPEPMTGASVAAREPAIAAAPVAAEPAKPPPAADEPAEKSLPALPRTMRINTWPKAVRILVDGREIGWAGIVNQVDLSPGRHVVRLESPSCHPYEREVEVPADGPVPAFVARLAWRPGLLSVTSEQNPDVAVDGVYKGNAARTLREPILVAIDRHNRVGRVKVHVRVSKSGFKTEDRVVEIAAGRKSSLRVTLEPQ
jgi:serine/threonine-protein kinase